MACLLYERERTTNLHVVSSLRLPLVYKDVRLDCVFIADLIVDGCVLIEVKSVETVAPIHFRQLTTYTRLADVRVGSLLNFGAAVLRDGIHRIVNRFPEE